MLVLKKKYIELEEKLTKAEGEISFLRGYKSKSDMKFRVIERLVRESKKGLLAKNKLIENILNLIDQ
jgi:hypothetical protein